MSNLKILNKSLKNITEKTNIIYFLTYDTKNHPRAAIKNT